MADDQLSWEALLNGAKKSASAPVSSVSEPGQGTKAEARPDLTSEPWPDPEETPQPKSPFERKAARPQKARTESQTSQESKPEPRLSEMDWTKLSFEKTASSPEPASLRRAADESANKQILSYAEPPKAVRVSFERKVVTTKIPIADATITSVVASTSSSIAKTTAAPRGEVRASGEPEAMSVSELNRAVKGTLEGKFQLLWVRGEISNFKAHTSGHFYFSLKDSKCQISAVMFRGFNGSLRFRPEDGMEVIVRGKITVFEPRGNYQIFCELMEPVGAGALQKAFEQLKAKLQAEGLFDTARKRPLPALPRHIAIVTSPTGAAIRDMLNVLGRRFKGARITLIPAKVQGDQAPGEVAAGIELANRLDDVDVLIVGRGGGSIEDLWAFNEEQVARAIAASRVPTISAVGHEIDFTIADFVADLRAPTPSAAAELVVKNAADIVAQVAALDRALKQARLRKQSLLKQALDGLSRRLVDPQRRLQDMSLRCDELAQRLEASGKRLIERSRMKLALAREKMGRPERRLLADRQAVSTLEARLSAAARNRTERRRQRFEALCALLDSYSPLKTVERGYAIVSLGAAAGQQSGAKADVVRDVDRLKVGSEVFVTLARGTARAEILEITKSDKGG